MMQKIISVIAIIVTLVLLSNDMNGNPYLFTISSEQIKYFVFDNKDSEEWEILQTLPLGYTSILTEVNRHKVIGNGWTVDVIAHIFSFLRGVEND